MPVKRYRLAVCIYVKLSIKGGFALANIRKKVKKSSAKKPKFDEIVFTSSKLKDNKETKANTKKVHTQFISMKKTSPQKHSTDKKDRNVAAKIYGLKLLKGGKQLLKKKKIIVALIVTVLVATLLIFSFTTPTGLTEYISNGFASIKSGNGYPVQPEGGKILYSDTSDNVFFSLTDTNFVGINKNGKEVLSFQHGFDNPAAVVSDARCLVYNYKNKKYVVTNYSDKVLSGELDNSILLGTICRNGSFAFVTKSIGFEGQVDVFNKKGNKVYSWFSANDPISNILLSNSGKRLATVTISASGGYIKSTISSLNFDSAVPIYKYELNGAVLDLKSYSNGFVAILTNKVVYYDWNKGEVLSKDFGKDKVSYFKINQSGENLVVCSKGIITNSYKIIYSKKQKEKFVLEYNGVITDIHVNSKSIYILSNKKVVVLNSKGEITESYEIPTLANSILVSKSGYIYVYNNTGVFKVN